MIVFLLAHVVELLAFAGCVKLSEYGFELIVGHEDPVFFERIHLKYLVAGADISLFCAFLIRGLIEFFRL